MRIKLHWKLTFIFRFVVILAISAGYFYLDSHLKSHVESTFENNVKHQLALNMGNALGLRVTIIALDGKRPMNRLYVN